MSATSPTADPAEAPGSTETVSGHEILTGNGHEPDRWRTRDLTSGGHGFCLIT